MDGGIALLEGSLPARFDYYGFTQAELGVRETVETLKAGLRSVEKVERLSGSPLGWGERECLLDCEGKLIASVHHGGPNGKYGNYVLASGPYADDVAGVAREWWPGHAVSRLDSCIDVTGDECWSQLHSLLLEVKADFPRLRWEQRHDNSPLPNQFQGSTIYLGSRSSPFLVRAYEKAKEQISKHPKSELPPDLNWCRVEAEVKPRREFRKQFSSLSPVQVWGASAQGRAILRRLSALEVEPVMMSRHRESDAKSKVRHMAEQYRSSMQEVIEEEGEEGLLSFIRQVWAEMDLRRKAA
jgi:hypothetical protein